MKEHLALFTARVFIVIAMLSAWTQICNAQITAFEPSSAVLVWPIPSEGTFWSISGTGGPLPMDPYPSLPLYTDTDGPPEYFWYDDSGYDPDVLARSSFGLRSMFSPDDYPEPPGEGGGGGSPAPPPVYNIPTYVLTTSYLQYTNFWLTIGYTSTNPSYAVVTIVDTLPGLTYQILTNTNLYSTTNWGVWQTLTATNTNTPAPPIDLSQQVLFFRGQIILTNAPYITNGLVVYWKLNDGSGTNAVDSSGNGYTLNLSNSPAWGSDYLTLNGSNQFGNAGTNPADFFEQSMSVCAWIYQTSNAYKSIVDKSFCNANGIGGWGFYVQDNGQLVYWGGHCAGSQCGETCVDYKGIVVPGQWMFVTAVFNWDGTPGDTTTDFYINGLPTSNPGNSFLINTPTGGYADLQLGNLGSNTSLPTGNYDFNGSMRDVAIYNRALSAGEVAYNYFVSDFPATVSVPDLLYYKLNTGSSNQAGPQTAYDSSTIGTNNGTIMTDTNPPNNNIQWTNGITGTPDANSGSNNYGALHFHGAGVNYIDTGNTNLFQFTTNLFTINLWVAPYTQSEVIMQTGINGTNGWYIANSIDNLTNDTTYTVYFGTETNGNETVFQTGPGNSGSQNNTWTMVTLVRHSLTNATFYINGVPEVSGIISIPAPSTTSLQIGRTPGVSDRSFDGDMWGIQIWGEPLTATSIANLYFTTSNAMNYP